MRLRVFCAGCAGRRTRRGRPGVEAYSPRGRCRPAIAGGFQWRDRQVGQLTWRLYGVRISALERAMCLNPASVRPSKLLRPSV